MTAFEAIGPLESGPGAGLPVIMRTRHRMSPDYVVQITLFDGDGVFTIGKSWYPDVPSAPEMEVFEKKLAKVLAPFLEAALQCAGLIEGDLW